MQPCTEDVPDQVNPERGPHNAGNSSDEESPERDHGLFEDPEFLLDESTFDPKKWGFNIEAAEVEWVRVPDFARRIQKSPPILVPEEHLITDVYQRQLPNCWLVAGLSELTEYPELLKKVVPPNQNCFGTGKVHLNLWSFGEWKEIIVDDRIPILQHDEHFGAKSSNAQVFWPPLLEKAFAKYCKGYNGALLPQDGMTLLTGGLCETIDLKTATVLKITENLGKAKSKNAMLFASTKPRSENDANEIIQGIGVYPQHVYSVYKTFNVAVRSGSLKGMHDFIVLKNPHDPENNPWTEGSIPGYHGPWSKHSYEWNAIPVDAKQEISHHAEGNEFCMPFETFKEYFDFIHICHLDKRNLGALPGGMNSYQVRGVYPNPEPLVVDDDGEIIHYSPNLHNNPRFLLKINGGDELVEVMLGLMVDPKSFEGGVHYLDKPKEEKEKIEKLKKEKKKQNILKHLSKLSKKLAKVVGLDEAREEKEGMRKISKMAKSLGIWIFPIEENCYLQSNHIHAYKNKVPTVGPDFVPTNQLVDRVKLFPGSYILIPSINANDVWDLEFFIRVFTEHDEVSLTAL